jgi:hypothetical protein
VLAAELSEYVAKTAERAKTYKTLAHSPDANPAKLGKLMDDATKNEWRSWLPETVRDFCDLSEDDVAQLDKLMAVQVALTNVDVFNDWKLFLGCCTAFNNRRANFEWLDQPSYLECAWACTVLRTLHPNTDFGPSVVRFITVVMIEDGLVFFPWSGKGSEICLDGTGLGSYAAGLTECSELAKDIKKVWDTGNIAGADGVEENDVKEDDAQQVQVAKLINAEAYIKTIEGK